MPECKHEKLVLITRNEKLRCRHCYLTITAKEIGEGYCPECYEAYGVKRRNFDKLEPEDNGKTQYRCEDCGMLVIS